MKTSKTSGARPFECPHCEKKFRTAAHKKSHVMQHFKDGEIVRDRVRERRRRAKPGIMGADVPLQEPILITDTGMHLHVYHIYGSCVHHVYMPMPYTAIFRP